MAETTVSTQTAGGRERARPTAITAPDADDRSPRTGGLESGGVDSVRRSSRRELQTRDLARREEADLLPGEAEAAVHVERRVPVAKEPAVEAADELSHIPRP